MNLSRRTSGLVLVIAALALIAAAIGLFWRDNGRPFAFLTVHGDIVQLYGQGLYRNEPLMNGAGMKGTDAFVIAFAVPLLLGSLRLARRGSLRGGLVLLGTLAYFLYNAAHQALSYAYNPVFPIYVALFGFSFFACGLVALAFDLPDLAEHFSARMPRRSIAAFLFTVGAALLAVWGGLSLLPAALKGATPAELASSTTLVTHAIDLAIIAPAAWIAGILLLRRAPAGYLLAPTIVIISWTLGGGVLAMSAAQILAGVLTGPQIAAFVVPFALLTLAGIWLTVLLFRDFSDPTAWRMAAA
jgi:hypothetical protein